MLYISTLDKNDVHTAYKALHCNYAENGGSFVPFHLTKYSKEDIYGLRSKSFGDTVAQVINMFFSAHLTGWDVDFALGRSVVKVRSLGSKIFVAELWHNAQGRFQHLTNELYKKVCVDMTATKPTQWFKVAVRIAVLFALYGAFLSESGNPYTMVDISVTATDLSVPTAVFYAKNMGLPIDTVICSCEENSAVWEFLYRGIIQQREDSNLISCFLHSVLGVDGLIATVSAGEKQGSSAMTEEMLQNYKSNLFTTAVGQQRVDSVIGSAYRTHQYIFHPAAAMAYGGLQDFRAIKGENRPALILEDSSPALEQKYICKLLNIKEKELTQQI